MTASRWWRPPATWATASDAVSYAPGNDPYVITVGAVDDQGTADNSDDVVASWSSQGTTQDGVAKPDVVAPGAHIVSTLAPNSDFASLCPTCVIDGSYFQVSGTSLAAPIVAGVAADLIAAHPDWTPAMVKGALVNTATQLPGGAHEVNARAANWADGDQLTSDQGLTPNTLIDPDTGSIDYNAASWSAGSWSTAADPLAASWSAASWSCVDCSAAGGSDDGSGGDGGDGRRRGPDRRQLEHRRLDDVLGLVMSAITPTSPLPDALPGSLTSRARHGCRAVRSPSGCSARASWRPGSPC